MLDLIKRMLSDKDYDYLTTELKDYELNEDEIYEFVWGLPTEKLHSRYITMAIVNSVRRGQFIVKHEIKYEKGLYFFDFWKEMNLSVDPREKCYIEHLISSIYQNGCSIERLRKTTNYIRDVKKPTDTKRFLEILKKSCLISEYNIDLEEWQKRAYEYYESWNEMIKIIEESEDDQERDTH